MQGVRYPDASEMRVTSPHMGTPEASPAVGPAFNLHSTPLVPLPLVTLNDLLWLLYLYPIRILARVLPRWCLYAVAKLSDPIIQFDARRSKARAAPWIAQACRTTPAHARRIASRSLTNTMLRTLDGLLLLRPSWEKMLHCTHLDGIQHLESAIARGKGVILLSGHFCATRIALRYLASQGHPALSVHNRQPPNKAEGRFGKRFLYPRSNQLQKRATPDQIAFQDPDSSLRIMRRLRAGGLVALQIDGRGGTPIEQAFLGVPWRVRCGIFEIVRLSDCAVVPMLCLGRSSGFRIRFDPMLEIDGASSREAFLAANLPRFLAVLERNITENPEEWRLWNNW
jgi:Kdo2-lipid IVA lauroyltransferase/acyltransferase